MDFSSHINPALLSLIPALYFLGYALKRGRFPAKHIPLTLTAAGIALALIWSLTEQSGDILAAVFTSIVQGILCAGGAVLTNQIIKQEGKK